MSSWNQIDQIDTNGKSHTHTHTHTQLLCIVVPSHLSIYVRMSVSYAEISLFLKMIVFTSKTQINSYGILTRIGTFIDSTQMKL